MSLNIKPLTQLHILYIVKVYEFYCQKVLKVNPKHSHLHMIYMLLKAESNYSFNQNYCYDKLDHIIIQIKEPLKLFYCKINKLMQYNCILL